MTLLQLANNDLRYSTMALMTGRDDASTRQCAFLLQQAIEKSLNFVLSENGVGYEKTHNLTKLISLVYGIGWTVPTYIVGRAQLITSWQYQARYYTKFHADIGDLEFTMQLTQNFVDKIAETYGLELIA